jgi:hypothetical protein
MTAQEKELIINALDKIKINETDDNEFEVSYSDKPQPKFCKDWKTELAKVEINPEVPNNYDTKTNKPTLRIKRANSSQLGLFRNRK